jgi:hypothetical protein
MVLAWCKSQDFLSLDWPLLEKSHDQFIISKGKNPAFAENTDVRWKFPQSFGSTSKLAGTVDISKLQINMNEHLDPDGDSARVACWSHSVN